MENGARELSRLLREASRSLLLKASLSAITIPVLVLALFSLTIFRFSARQYLVFLLALAAAVVPLIIAFAVTYLSRQRRLMALLAAWHEQERDPGDPRDRLLATRLQGAVDRSSVEHGLMVAAGIFLSIALSVLLFGRYADFTPYTSVAYISLGGLLALTDFFVTLFISHREMRPVLRAFLHDCRGFGFHAAAGIGRRLAVFSMTILLLALGITWIASSYISSDVLKEELVLRGRDNALLLAERLADLEELGTLRAGGEAIAADLAISEDEMLVLFDEGGEAFLEISRGKTDEGAWRELAKGALGEGTTSHIEQAGRSEFLVTSCPLGAESGVTLVRVSAVDTSFQAMGRLAPTMLLLLLLGVGVAAFLTLLMTRNLADPIRRLVHTCRVVGTGDLTVEVPVDSLDDMGELASSYGEMLGSLRHISSELRETSGEVSEGAVSIVAVSEQIMAAIEELNALVQDLSGQIEHEVDQIRNVEEIMRSVAETISMSHAEASRSFEISRDAETAVREGREHARDAVEKIADFKAILDQSMEAILSLGESSQKIGAIVDIITRIADQTNLLALNAAIEAARVPEHGKGFAVVADEVKKLAQEAAGSAQRIHDLVRAIQGDVEVAKALMEKGTMGMYVGMETVERTDQSLASISDIVGEMARMANAIAEASSRELAESERLADSLRAMKEQVETTAGAYEEIGASSEEQTAATTELAGTAERLSQIAEKLQEMVAHFKLS